MSYHVCRCMTLGIMAVDVCGDAAVRDWLRTLQTTMTSSNCRHSLPLTAVIEPNTYVFWADRLSSVWQEGNERSGGRSRCTWWACLFYSPGDDFSSVGWLLTVFQFERTNAKRLNRKTALSSFTHISVSAAVLSRQIMSKITRMWQADRCFVALAREYRFYLATRLTSASVVSSVHCNGYATVVWSEFGLLGSSFLRIRFDAVVWSKVLIGCLCLVVCSRTDGSRASLYNSNLSLVDKTTLTWVLMFESGLCLAWSRMNRSISLLTFAGWLCWYPSISFDILCETVDVACLCALYHRHYTSTCTTLVSVGTAGFGLRLRCPRWLRRVPFR